MRLLDDLTGAWSAGKESICFTWNTENIGQERYLAIIALNSDGNMLTVDEQNRNIYSLENVNSGIVINNFRGSVWVGYNGDAAPGITGIRFIGLVSEQPDDLNKNDAVLAAARQNEKRLPVVMIGTASVVWSMKEKQKSDARVITFTVKSDQFVEAGVMAYTYQIDNETLKFPFPEIYENQQMSFGPVAVPPGASLELTVYESSYGDNLKLRQKPKFLGIF